MFKKILIANRGEIACRVIRTARAMGIITVAVYSEADQDALHVRLADESACIGPPPAAASYLDQERILQVCREHCVDALHPGYGFLSENAEFAALVEREGIVFLGPPAAAITAMGDKMASKRIAAAAGVRTIPGCDEEIRDGDHAVAAAAVVGYPVMLKASAGGGGKGMRIAHDERECREGFARATSEALASFGDGRILLEKFIPEPRHIEMQILADRQGHVLYLGERECSVQRRHQKVIEEAPSPLLDEKTRRRMGEQAVALARAVGYVSAGTVEFVADQERNFYFLEMNTRLQVEHPITEMVTGLDLVEQMIRIGAGEALELTQDQVRTRGWAMECRVYAEDPRRGFLPSIGRLVRYRPPEEEADRVRVDTGVFEGSDISISYDPMIAKLVTWGRDREQAILAMQHALDAYVIEGVRHNLDFLADLLTRERFRLGHLSTAFIAEEYPGGFLLPEEAAGLPLMPLVAAAVMHRLYMDRASRISGQLPGYERMVRDDWVLLHGLTPYPVRVRPRSQEGEFLVEHRGKRHAVFTDWSFGGILFQGTVNGQSVALQVERCHLAYRLRYRGSRYDVQVLTPRGAELYRHMPEKSKSGQARVLLAPMPGLLTRVAVVEGQEVKSGEELVIIEAMKMENVLKAEQDCVIGRIVVMPGTSLGVDQLILEFA